MFKIGDTIFNSYSERKILEIKIVTWCTHTHRRCELSFVHRTKNQSNYEFLKLWKITNWSFRSSLTLIKKTTCWILHILKGQFSFPREMSRLDACPPRTLRFLLSSFVLSGMVRHVELDCLYKRIGTKPAFYRTNVNVRRR